MKTISWKLRSYLKGDESGIIDLDRRVFFEQSPDRFSEEYWRWEFVKNPDGISNIWVADDHGLIVGHYAVIPRMWKIDDGYHMGSIVVDVMTDDRYRFQGMFAALGKAALADSGEKGILFSYGFPVRADVMPGHLKVGWEHIFDIPVLVYPQNFIPIVQYYFMNKVVSQFVGTALNLIWSGYRKIVETITSFTVKSGDQYLIREVDAFNEDFDHLWDRASKQFSIVSSRTKKYLNWRYKEHPYYKYKTLSAYAGKQLVGYIITREENILGLNCGVIVDLFVDPERFDALDYLIHYVKTYYRDQRNISLIALMISKSNRYYDLLKKHSFFVSPKKFWFILHKNSKDVLPFDFGKLYNPGNWLLTWGDTDVI